MNTRPASCSALAALLLLIGCDRPEPETPGQPPSPTSAEHDADDGPDLGIDAIEPVPLHALAEALGQRGGIDVQRHLVARAAERAEIHEQHRHERRDREPTEQIEPRDRP